MWFADAKTGSVISAINTFHISIAQIHLNVRDVPKAALQMVNDFFTKKIVGRIGLSSSDWDDFAETDR